MRVGLAKKVVVLVRIEKGRQFGCNVVVCLVVAFAVDRVVVTTGERDMAGDVVLYPSPLEVQVRARARARVPVHVLVLVLGVRDVLALSVVSASVCSRYRQDRQGPRPLCLALLPARPRCRHWARGSEGRPCPRKMWEAPQSDKAGLVRRDSGSWCSSIDQEVDSDQSCGLLFFLFVLFDLCLFVCMGLLCCIVDGSHPYHSKQGHGEREREKERKKKERERGKYNEDREKEPSE